MTQPLWIDYASVADVAPPEQLAEQATSGHHVVLRFPSLLPDEESALIRQLSTALPEFSVFNSSGGLKPAWITILPVVQRARVLKHRRKVLQAVAEYRQACAELVEQHRTGILSPKWQSDEHGGHCRFTNLETGQVVEAPFREWVRTNDVDPYFFAEYVKTTAGLQEVTELIEHPYHDAKRVLDVVGVEDEPNAPPIR